MPRSPRIEFPGAIFHVMNRGNHLEPFFGEDFVARMKEKLEGLAAKPRVSDN
ncbi:MAG: hypothetical protein HY360_12125 [Verrucomicrobia bacterium]|nr:hypothetical protein [Verrucomicrobiota bacterium]